jgi:hypothetical protein
VDFQISSDACHGLAQAVADAHRAREEAEAAHKREEELLMKAKEAGKQAHVEVEQHMGKIQGSIAERSAVQVKEE